MTAILFQGVAVQPDPGVGGHAVVDLDDGVQVGLELDRIYGWGAQQAAQAAESGAPLAYPVAHVVRRSLRERTVWREPGAVHADGPDVGGQPVPVELPDLVVVALLQQEPGVRQLGKGGAEDVVLVVGSGVDAHAAEVPPGSREGVAGARDANLRAPRVGVLPRLALEGARVWASPRSPASSFASWPRRSASGA